LAIEKDIGKKYFTHKCQNQKLHPKDTSMFGKQSCVIIQLTDMDTLHISRRKDMTYIDTKDLDFFEQ